MVENYANNKVKAVTDEYVEKDIQGAVATAYVLAVKKEVQFSTKIARPLIHRITVRGTPGEVNLGLGWSF